MSVILNGKLRKEIGKKSTRKMRREGLLPAVLYGQKDNLSIAVNSKELVKILKQNGRNALIHLSLEEGSSSIRKVLLKDYQQHPLREDWLHADFLEVSMKQLLKVRVKVLLTGSSPGVKKGGILNHVIQELSLECLPEKIPESIEVSIDKLDLEDAIHVSDLQIPEEVKVLNPASATVAIVHAEKKEEEKPEEGEDIETPSEGKQMEPSAEGENDKSKAENK